MINSFQPLNTITSGLILQQLEQEVNANNIAQPSVDSQGYLMNSLERVNSESNPAINITGSNGLLSIGTGASATSITSLRSSYLDSQIQQQSTVVGYNEVLSNSNSTGIMDEISSIVNGTTTLSSTLSSFAAQWGTLASAAPPSSPTNVNFASDQQNVVNAGVAFANAASAQFNQLQSLQLSTNNQINQTVGEVNGLLQQLASINGQLLQTGGSNQNNLLDARDYALDKLSRLVNFQVNYGTNGTTNLWLGDVALVNGTTASALQTAAENINNPQLLDITLQVPGGTYSNETNVGVKSSYDITSLITGGNLGGEIYGRNVLLQSYKVQVDQIASSVINITNGVYSAGYIANGSTTGIDFFTGTGASNVAVNGALVSAPTTLATEIQATSTGAPSPTIPLPSGTLAEYLSNIPSLLTNNYMASEASIGTPINPTQSIFSQGLSLTPGTSSFTLNGVSITYTDANSINDILNEINAKVPSVYAVFNATAGEFDFYSSNPINFVGTGGDDFAWANLQNVLVSSFNMNNVSAPDPKLNVYVTAPLNSTTVLATFPLPGQNYGPNTEAYLVTPSASGSFTISYVNAGVPTTTTINWNNTQTLNGILSSLPAPLNYLYLNNEQSFEIFAPSPIQIVDNSGNFTAFTGLNGNLSLQGMALNVSANASSQETTLQATYTSSSASLTQLNNEQDNLAGASGSYTVSGVAQNVGVPLATIEQQAYQSMITYNAMLEVMAVIDQMLDALVGISSTTSTNGIFQQQTNG